MLDPDFAYPMFQSLFHNPVCLIPWCYNIKVVNIPGEFIYGAVTCDTFNFLCNRMNRIQFKTFLFQFGQYHATELLGLREAPAIASFFV